jgi:hypothetical protein
MTRSNSPAPAISLEVILPRIIQQCLCEGNACELAVDRNFVNARFRAHQIYYLYTFGFNWLHRRLAMKAIARVFDVQPKMFATLWRRARQLQKDVESTLHLKWTPSNT